MPKPNRQWPYSCKLMQPEPGDAQRAVGGAGATRKDGGGAVITALASFSFVITASATETRKAGVSCCLAGFGSFGTTTEGHGPRGSWKSLAVARVLLIWHVCVQALANNDQPTRSIYIFSRCKASRTDRQTGKAISISFPHNYVIITPSARYMQLLDGKVILKKERKCLLESAHAHYVPPAGPGSDAVTT